MSRPDHRRHDIDDRAWAIIGSLLPGQRGGIAEDDRRLVNAVLWILRIDASRRDLPLDHGARGNAPPLPQVSRRRAAGGSSRPQPVCGIVAAGGDARAGGSPPNTAPSRFRRSR